MAIVHVALCLALLRPPHLRGSSSPLLTRRPTVARTRALAAADDAPPPTAPAADVFAGMKEPIPVDSPEGAEALRRMNEELTQAEADGAPASPPTAPAADVFAGMVSPIPVDSPEGAEALARLKREQNEEGPTRGADTSDDFFELASPAPTRGADTSDDFLDLASPAPPVAAVAPPPAAPPPPPMLEIQEAGLYPVPELGAPTTLFGQELPFGIQPMAFLITSAVAVFLTLLLGYLFFLTATN